MEAPVWLTSELLSKERHLEAKDYLAYIVSEIHTTIVATVDDEGLPVTAAIDMMDSDDNSLYFLTTKGKGFYERLKKRGFLAMTALKGQDTMSSVAISIRGKVRELGYERIPALFEKNPYMHQIYPTEKAMQALTVFQIYEPANGLIFQKNRLSGLPSPSAALGRRRKASSSRTPVSAVEAACRYARRTASILAIFHFTFFRSIACTAATV